MKCSLNTFTNVNVFIQVFPDEGRLVEIYWENYSCISKTVSFIDAMVSRAIKVAAALTEVTAGSSKGGLTAEMLATMAMGETTAGAVHVAGTMHPHKSRK